MILPRRLSGDYHDNYPGRGVTVFLVSELLVCEILRLRVVESAEMWTVGCHRDQDPIYKSYP